VSHPPGPALSMEVAVLRIRVTKPTHGRVDLVFDDRRGATGMYRKLENVETSDVQLAVGPILEDYLQMKAILRDQRRSARA